MCGIAGVLSASGGPVPTELIEDMTTAIAHRGPDDHGVHLEGPVALGNRRLAIIDLSPAGHQPMANEAGDLVLTFNGEIYNFRELRSELERLGHRFRSRSDTEVVLHAYEEWDNACLGRFNGMFAFAVWDARRRTLFLARDRYGIKPLYHTQVGADFLFSSEVKSLLRHPDMHVEASLPHLLEYFTFQNIFSDGTLFDGVKLLPAGSSLTIQTDGGEPRLHRYWDFHFHEETDGEATDEEYVEELDRLFRQAVERQLVSDVPVGAYLSGGMDSGSITAISAESLPYLSTFTGGFDLTSASGLELGFDERRKAETMSYRFKTEHYQTVLKAGDMERCLSQLVWHLEDLRVGQSYPNYYVARLASKFVKVVLSGSGGDELFAGYPWRYYRAVVNDDFDHYVEKYYRFWHRLAGEQIHAGILPTSGVGRGEREGHHRSLPLDASRPRTPAGVARGVRELLPLPRSEDLPARAPGGRGQTQHGTRARDKGPVPRQRSRRFRAALAGSAETPRSRACRQVERERAQPQDREVLREDAGREAPAAPRHGAVCAAWVTEQVKQGFSGPDASWFRGESMDYVRRVLLSNDAAIYEFLQPQTVQRLVREHFEGKENRRLLLWSLLNFEHWCRTFLGAGPEASHAPDSSLLSTGARA